MITVFKGLNMMNPVSKCDNSELISTDGLYIRRFDDELFIAHPNFQYNLKINDLISTYDFGSFVTIRDIFEKSKIYILFLEKQLTHLSVFSDCIMYVEYNELSIIRDFLQPIIKCYNADRCEKPPSWR